jgi:hypothetical protein
MLEDLAERHDPAALAHVHETLERTASQQRRASARTMPE